MGIINAPAKCFFTDLPTNNIPSGWDAVEYYVNLGKKRLLIRISYHDLEQVKQYITGKKWLLKGLILNEIWHNEDLTNSEALDRLIESNKSIIPTTPKDKKDKILSYFYKQQKYDGEPIDVVQDISNDESYWLRLFLKNRKEFYFYLNLLKEEHLLQFNSYGGPPGTPLSLASYTILAKGIEYVLNLQEGEYSNNCFVAMSFTNPEMEGIYDNAIKPAIEQTGFTPIRIDKEHLPSDTSINDGIIASIKKSRFTIADFTDQKNGVYFEAGFALGRGQKVIYTCKASDVDKLHFDIRSYQQIIWKDAVDFKQKLIDKIEAFIK